MILTIQEDLVGYLKGQGRLLASENSNDSEEHHINVLSTDLIEPIKVSDFIQHLKTNVSYRDQIPLNGEFIAEPRFAKLGFLN